MHTMIAQLKEVGSETFMNIVNDNCIPIADYIVYEALGVLLLGGRMQTYTDSLLRIFKSTIVEDVSC